MSHPPAGPSQHRPRGRCFRWAQAAAWLGAGLVLGWTPVWSQPLELRNLTINIGFSSRAQVNANRTDVTAALKAWFLAITQERKLALKADIKIYRDTGEMETALRRGQIDIFSAAADEFLALEKVIPMAGIFVNTVGGKFTEEYVLLVHRDGPVRELKDLRDQGLFMLEGPRTTLAPYWLDIELLRRKLPVSTGFFGKITLVTKASQAILPVFFKQVQAGLVTRAQFNLASELNPQLAKNLRILATSPEVVPIVASSKSGRGSAALDFYRQEIRRVHDSTGGRQTLNLFQSDDIIELKASDLDSTRALLAEYARLKPKHANP